MDRPSQVRERTAAGPDAVAWQSALVAQLHYDRSDIARISPGAAAAMDVVISLVMAAVRDPGSAAQLTATGNAERH